jgi:hypothetical protein
MCSFNKVLWNFHSKSEGSLPDVTCWTACEM